MVNSNADPNDPSNWFSICPSSFFTSSRKLKKELRHIYRSLRNIPGFDKFDKELKDIIISTINEINSNDNKIKFSNEYCIILYAKNYFNSPEFIQILNHLQIVYFELDYPYSVDDLFEKISGLSNSNDFIVNICLNISDISVPPEIAGCSVPISIKLDDALESIPTNAFSDCKSVYEVNFGASLRTIGERSFSGCESLGKVTIPSGVIEIGIGAFEGCTNLE